jgi:hypothetical protein
MKKILLLNPPSDKLCVKDYYCSFSSKAQYCWPPQDLVVLSGIIASRYEVDYLDPYAYKLGFDRSLEAVSRGNYAAVIFTTGSLNLSADLEFIRRIKDRLPGVKLIGSSSIFHSIGAEVMNKAVFLDGALLDFTNSDILSFLSGDYSGIKNMIYRRQGDLITCLQGSPDGPFSFPVPLHGLFDCKHYKLPFFIFKGRRFITTISSLGCPYKCTFCVASGIKYRVRGMDNLMEELSDLSRHQGQRNIFFADCNFTAGGRRLKEFCSRMYADYRGVFNWICNSRAEPLLEADTVRSLKRAGCRMIMLGAESGDQQILDKYNKGISLQEIKEAVANCRENGIYTLLYFMLGLPGEDKGSLRKTADFIKGLDCDFISLSFAVPDFGTGLRKESLRNGWCRDDFGGWDHSAGQYLSGDWKNGELARMRNRIYRKFYLRPSWMLRRAKDLAGLRLTDLGEGCRY